MSSKTEMHHSNSYLIYIKYVPRFMKRYNSSSGHIVRYERLSTSRANVNFPRKLEASVASNKIITLSVFRNNTLSYLILIETTCTSIFLVSLFTDFRQRRLKYREWVPYDYSSYAAYCFTYAQQMVSTFHSATVNIACDTFFCALLMHIYCQIEILEYRLRKVSSDQNIMSYCIRHHNRIFE